MVVEKLSRRTRLHPDGGVMTVPLPPRTATCAIIRSLGCTPMGTLTTSCVLTVEVLPVPVARHVIRVPPGVAVGVAEAVKLGVGTAVAVGRGVLLGVGLLALGVAPGVGNGLAAAVGVGVGVAAVRGASAISAPMLGAELLAGAISLPVAPSVLKSRSDAAAPTPPLPAPKLQRGRVGGGSVNP